MTQYRLAPIPDAMGWRFALRCKGRLPFAQEKAVPSSDWPAVTPSHAGVALLLALVDAEEAQIDGETVRLTHDRVARLSSAEAARLQLPPAVPFTLFLSHDAPIGEVGFALRLEWFQRDGAPVFGAEREGTALKVGPTSPI